MKVLRLFPLVLALAACSSVNLPLSPYRIDVQQGNALEQESVEKLKLGLNRSQVRFLLGTPLLVDPFHGNRWDYVYNSRKAGKLTEERRLVLYFDGDVLARIEAEGLALKPEQLQPKIAADKSAEKTAEQPKPSRIEVNPVAVAMPLAVPPPIQPRPVAEAEPAALPPVATPSQPEPVPAQPVAVPSQVPPPPVAAAQPPIATAAETAVKPAPATAPSAPVAAAAPGVSETSIVPPLTTEPGQVAKPQVKTVAVKATPPEPVALQPEVNVEAIKPDAVPEFPETRTAAGTPQERVAAALNAWAKAWRLRDEEAYFAAYAPGFRPANGQSREEWEKRRRLLLGVSRNIDLQIDGVATEAVTEDRAQVSFRQLYRSDSYRDAVIKQLKFVRIENRWLIEEENVLTTIKGGK